MPLITRTFIKTSLVYFVLALVAGLLTAVARVISLPPVFNRMTPVYFHLLMVGWVTLMIMGVAFWMFPRFTKELPRGHIWLMWAAYGLINVGLILRVIAEPMLGLTAGSMPWGELLAASALTQWLGGLCFVANVWPRLQER